MWLLAYILATLTQHDRQKVVRGVDFEWSKSWTYNLFRVYELIFWRRAGLRCEQITTPTKHTSFTWENFFVTLEEQLHHKLPRLSVVRVPVLQTVGLQIPLSPYRFAVAFDTAVSGLTASSWSHTVTGSNPIILGSGHGDVGGATNAQSATYAGNACTLVDGQATTGSRTIYQFLQCPTTTGANTFALSGPAFNRGVSASYSGANQSGQPDGHTSAQNASGTVLTTSLTVTAPNCWAVMAAYDDADNSFTFNQGVITTGRGSANDGGQFADSNGTVSTGSVTVGFSHATTTILGLTTVSIAPVSVATVNSGFFLWFNRRIG